MTARANSVTERATKPAGNAGWVWTAPTSDFRALMDAFGRLGYNVEALLASAGVRDTDLDDPDGRVPCEAYGAVVSRAQQERFTPNLALEVARMTPMGAYPLLDYLVLSCDSVGEAYRQLARYFRLVSPCVLEIQDAEDPVRVVMPGGDRFGSEYTLPLSIFHLRRETGNRLRVESLSLSHRPDDVADFERRVGCPIRPEAGWNGVSVSRSNWKLPLARRDPILRGILERQVNERGSAVSPEDSRSEVRRLILQRVSGGDTRIQSVARMIATTPRTLQRRLAAEGTSYQELLEGVRREAAEGYLAGSGLSVSEIAYLLGYSEPAAFHRAFRRWHGVTPGEYRRRGRETGTR